MCRIKQKRLLGPGISPPRPCKDTFFSPIRRPPWGNCFAKVKKKRQTPSCFRVFLRSKSANLPPSGGAQSPAFFFTPVAVHTPLHSKLSSEAVPNKYYDRKFCRSLRIFYRSTCSAEGCQGNHEACGSRGGRGVRTVQQTVRYACHLMKRMDGGPCRSPFSELISFRFGPTDKFYARRMMSHVSLRQCLPSESSSMAYSRR